MKEQHNKEKGGKRVKKSSGRSGIRLAFLFCCCLAIAAAALWQSGMLARLFTQNEPESSVGGQTSVIQSAPAEPDKSTDGAASNVPAPDEKNDGADSSQPQQTDTPWYLMLVNKWNALPEDYQVELVELDNGQSVDKRIYPSLQKMFNAARADGVYPIVASGYRTPEKQQSLMDEKIEEYKAQGYEAEAAKAEAKKWVAVPGTSEHQLGFAVDINADGIQSAGYEVYDWLDAHAHEYGFICRYPQSKTEITGISNEPWHYRYVGIEAATEIHDQGVCLEEYLGQVHS